MAISTPLHADRSFRSRALRYGALTLSVAAVLVAAFVLSRSSVFDVRDVQVRGAAHLADADVIALAAIADDASVPWLDEAAVESRLERDPWVRDAAVSVGWPRTVRIVVHEREPVAVAVDGATRELIAADGTILGPADGTSALPEVVLGGGDPDDRRVAEAATVLASIEPRVARSVERVVVDGTGAIELRLTGGPVVRYGTADAASRKAAALAEILRWSSRSGEELARISLVAPDLPAVTFAT